MADSLSSPAALDAARIERDADAPPPGAGREAPIPMRSAAMVALAIAAALSTQVLLQTLAAGAPFPSAIADWLRSLADHAVVATAILASIALAMHLPAPGPPTWRVTAAIVAGAFAGSLLVEASYWPLEEVTLASAAPNGIRFALIGGIAALIVAQRKRIDDAAAHEIDHRIALDRLALAESEARLALLRSQVEPHFLFNTLATIQRLQRTDLPAGRDALAGFIDYLCGALPLMGQRETSLGEEVDLAAAYLSVIRARMGARLATTIDVPAGLRDLAVPPFAVATLVENAVRHGLAPLREGGSLAISASAAGDRLRVRVEDTGVGVQGSGGAGTGLAHLRARLEVLHGGRASLRIRANRPSGVVAEIELPLARAGNTGTAA